MSKDVLSQQKKYYDEYLKIKDNPRYRKIWKFLSKKDMKGLKILDIGCSNGDFSAPLLKEGADCYGIEYIEKAFGEAKERGIKVSRGSFLEKFPFEDNFFDVIFAGEVLEHTIEDDKFLSEVNRVLKGGGLFVLTTPNLVSLGNRFLMAIGKMPRFAYSEFHYRIYNKKILTKKIKSEGFLIKKIDSNYVIISTFFNKYIGFLGEILGTLFPSFGENFIIYAEKKSNSNFS